LRTFDYTALVGEYTPYDWHARWRVRSPAPAGALGGTVYDRNDPEARHDPRAEICHPDGVKGYLDMDVKHFCIGREPGGGVQDVWTALEAAPRK
jgi:hypothetical protein